MTGHTASHATFLAAMPIGNRANFQESGYTFACVTRTPKGYIVAENLLGHGTLHRTAEDAAQHVCTTFEREFGPL